ncbi:MAG: protein kinase [Candidatus Schekmanbacteria bacterium]|nr:protein kinase [Candidatus Schekmanbacteria bacterium]
MTTETFGRYHIRRQLGSGAMGVVYEAEDPRIRRTVAIKAFRTGAASQQGASEEEFRKRFQREAQTAGVLSHPGIVTIYDIGEHEGAPYIAMEFVDGMPLSDYVKSHWPLPFAAISRIVTEVASALDYAHQQGIVHRDIKPANIMLTSTGAAKITDFGIARFDNSELTQTGVVLGTPAYMSPEQIKGKPLDGRSDIFSLGVVTYWMLTGKRPFAGENVMSLVYRIVSEPARPIQDVDPQFSGPLNDVMAKILAKSPDSRYQRGGEFARDLSACLARLGDRTGAVPDLPESDSNRMGPAARADASAPQAAAAPTGARRALSTGAAALTPRDQQAPPSSQSSRNALGEITMSAPPEVARLAQAAAVPPQPDVAAQATPYPAAAVQFDTGQRAGSQGLPTSTVAVLFGALGAFLAVAVVIGLWAYLRSREPGSAPVVVATPTVAVDELARAEQSASAPPTAGAPATSPTAEPGFALILDEPTTTPGAETGTALPSALAASATAQGEETPIASPTRAALHPTATPRAGASPSPPPLTTPTTAITEPAKPTAVVALETWSGPAFAFSEPWAIAAGRSGELTVLDKDKKSLSIIANGSVRTRIGSDTANPVAFEEPVGLAADASGNLYVADPDAGRVFKLSRAGAVLWVTAENSEEKGKLEEPAGVAVTRNGEVLVLDVDRKLVVVFNSRGEFIAEWSHLAGGRGKRSAESLNDPIAIAVGGPEDLVYIVDDKETVKCYTSNGQYRWSWDSTGSGKGKLEGVEALTVDRHGRVFVADASANRVYVFDARGKIITAWGEKGKGTGQFAEPRGLAVAGDGRVYVVDTDNKRVQIFGFR